MKDQRLTIKLSDEMKQRLMAEAESKGTTASSLLRMIIIDYFKKGGF